MNIAVVLAGGIGSRTGHCVPKQYLTVKDKPIIVYTLETLQKSGLFNEIYAVCDDKWAEFIRSYADEYQITSYKTAIPSGETRFETISNAIAFMNGQGKSGEDVICFVDSNRPLIPVKTYDETLKELEKCDFVFSSSPIYDAMFTIDKDTGEVTGTADRTEYCTGQSPMATRLKDALEALEFAKKWNSEQPLAVVMMKMKKTVHTVLGAAENRKITTAEDFALFEAMLDKYER